MDLYVSHRLIVKSLYSCSFAPELIIYVADAIAVSFVQLKLSLFGCMIAEQLMLDFVIATSHIGCLAEFIGFIWLLPLS